MKINNFKNTAGFNGFTLIEVMIVVAVVAILSAIALPNYTQYIIRSHRADARNTLLTLAQKLEQNYTLAANYSLDPAGSAINNATITTWGLNASPAGGATRYNITFSAGEPTTTTFVVQAVPTGAQTADATCATLTLSSVGLQSANGQNNRSVVTRDCWGR